MNKVIVTISLLFLFSCGSVYFVPHEETTDSTTQVEEHPENSKPTYRVIFDCQECNIVPVSGSNKDLRKGYYFDLEEGMCKEFWYSSGADCVPPPFKTLEECVSCCGR